MIPTYARAAFAAGYAEVEGAFPMPTAIVPLMRAAVEVAELTPDRPGVLHAVRESGRREALHVVIQRRREQLEAHWSARFRPLVASVGTAIAPLIAQRFAPKEAVEPTDDPMAEIEAAIVAAADEGDWTKLLQLAHEAAQAEGQASATALVADAQGALAPSLDLTFQAALDAITQIPGSWEGAQGWLDKAAHSLAYDTGPQVADAIAKGASYDELLGIVQQGFSGPDNGATLIVSDMIATGSNQGSLDLYVSEGLQQVDILVSPGAEEICQGLEDRNPWSIDDAQGQIPAHPNCRCSWTPIVS